MEKDIFDVLHEQLEKTIFELHHYGKYLTDENICTKEGDYIRIMNIRYKNQIWYHVMKNGKTQDLQRIF